MLLVAGSHQETTAAEVAARLGGTRSVERIIGAHVHVPAEDVDRAAEVLRLHGADTVVAIGGGSALGLGKALALQAEVILVAVPTTYSGSEMTPIWGMSTDGEKRTGRDLRVLPRTVMYDPELTLGLPPPATAASAFNALAHCVEALWLAATDPVTRSTAEDAAAIITTALPTVSEDPSDLAARTDLLFGAYRAGVVVAAAGIGLHHRTCHVLGGMFGLDHGGMNSTLLPHMIAFHRDDELAGGPLARILGPQPARAAFDLAVATGAPTSLHDLGMPEEGLAPATAAVTERTGAAVDGVDGIAALLDRAWRGLPPT